MVDVKLIENESTETILSDGNPSKTIILSSLAFNKHLSPFIPVNPSYLLYDLFEDY